MMKDETKYNIRSRTIIGIIGLLILIFTFFVFFYFNQNTIPTDIPRCTMCEGDEFDLRENMKQCSEECIAVLITPTRFYEDENETMIIPKYFDVSFYKENIAITGWYVSCGNWPWQNSNVYNNFTELNSIVIEWQDKDKCFLPQVKARFTKSNLLTDELEGVEIIP